MGCGCDLESALLLCAEDNSSILGFDDGEVGRGDVGDDRWGAALDADDQKRGLYGDLSMDFPLQSDGCLALLLSRESCHLPKKDYARRLQTGDLDLSVRREAINWIEKAHSHFSFGPLCLYLSANYLDRFLSCYEIPVRDKSNSQFRYNYMSRYARLVIGLFFPISYISVLFSYFCLWQKKEWMTQLLSVACLSLAAKMEETEVPVSLDLQQVGESKFVFEARTIQRMELLVLSTLNWRMQSVTPFSFIDYFLLKLNDDNPPPRSLLSQSAELIVKTISRIEFLEFRPSEIAATVALYVYTETQKMDVNEVLPFCIHISKERAFRCYELIKDIALVCKAFTNATESVSVPQSPIGVLDAACLSYRSDDATFHAETTSRHTIPDTKRRKVNR